MAYYQLIALLALAALILSWIFYPVIYRFAQKHKIVDNPNQRKLQKHPVPLLGGYAIALAMIMPIIVSALTLDWTRWYITVVFIIFALIIGLLDDIYELSARMRFGVEIILVGLYILLSHSMIGNIYGLWGIEHMSLWIAVPLSIVAGVGIINSINLIDGIDGYSSGFGILGCSLFGIFFISIREWALASFMLIVAAAIVPFFCYNVFSKKKKMFIGDGGTLMIGAIMTVTIFHILSPNSIGTEFVQKGMGLVAFCLAVVCIPVFDTVRVMCERILRRTSPFTADKTHLHHLFLEHQFSHLQTTFFILCINLLIVGIWYVSYRLALNIDIQLYIVVGLGILSTFGLSTYLRRKNKHKSS